MIALTWRCSLLPRHGQRPHTCPGKRSTILRRLRCDFGCQRGKVGGAKVGAAKGVKGAVFGVGYNCSGDRFPLHRCPIAGGKFGASRKSPLMVTVGLPGARNRHRFRPWRSMSEQRNGYGLVIVMDSLPPYPIRYTCQRPLYRSLWGLPAWTLILPVRVISNTATRSSALTAHRMARIRSDSLKVTGPRVTCPPSFRFRQPAPDPRNLSRAITSSRFALARSGSRRISSIGPRHRESRQ